MTSASEGAPERAISEVRERAAREMLALIRTPAPNYAEKFERWALESKYDVWNREPTGPDIGYLIRTSREYNLAYGGFPWPSNGYVEVPPGDLMGIDPNGSGTPNNAIRGLHGLLDGIGNWLSLIRHPQATWQLVAVRYSECKPCISEWAHRAPRGWVVYSGEAVGAVSLIMPKMLSSPRLSELIDVMTEVRRTEGRQP